MGTKGHPLVEDHPKVFDSWLRCILLDVDLQLRWMWSRLKKEDWLGFVFVDVEPPPLECNEVALEGVSL